VDESRVAKSIAADSGGAEASMEMMRRCSDTRRVTTYGQSESSERTDNFAV